MKIIQGHLDTVLSEKGIQQAELLGQHLQNEHFSHVYSSDLSRARQTCEIILNQNKSTKTQMVVDKRLRERKLGVLEGQPISKCRALIKCNSNLAPSTGMETKQQLREHAKSFFCELCTILQKYFLENRPTEHVRVTESKKRKFGSSSSSLPDVESCQVLNPQSVDANQVATSSSDISSTYLFSSTEVNSENLDSLSEVFLCSSASKEDVTFNMNSQPAYNNDSWIESNHPNVSVSPSIQRTQSRFSSVSSGHQSPSFDLDSSTSNIAANVLVVSHGGLLTELIGYFIKELNCKVPGSQQAASQIMPNATISRFTVGLDGSDVSKIFCVSLHDKDHLANNDVAPLGSIADLLDD